MKKLTVLAIIGLSVLLGSCNFSIPAPTPEAVVSEPIEAQANFWQQLGGLIDSSAGDAAIAHFKGVPFIAYRTIANESYNIYVKQWNAASWVQLSTVLDGVRNPSSIFDFDMAVDTSGSPVVVWSEYGPVAPDEMAYYNYVFAKRWNGASWVSLGTVVNTVSELTSSTSYYVSLTIDSSGNPVVAYDATSLGAPTNVFVKRWNGSAWVSYDTTGIPVGNIRDLDVALDNTSQPVVAWTDKQFPTALFVKHWNGSAWVEYGTGGMLNVSTDAGSQAGHISLGVRPKNET